MLVVTHSPQVAALGQAHHWRVEKRVKDDATLSTVVPLDPRPEREGEIARMLSGDTVTEEARAAAEGAALSALIVLIRRAGGGAGQEAHRALPGIFRARRPDCRAGPPSRDLPASLPGFRMPCGSSACLIAPITVPGRAMFGAMYPSLPMPTPCSPVQVPPRRSARSAIRAADLGGEPFGRLVGIGQQDRVEIAVAHMAEDRAGDGPLADIGLGLLTASPGGRSARRYR